MCWLRGRRLLSRGSIALVALAATIGIGACHPEAAGAQSCNQAGTACVDTAGPLMPAQLIEFRVEAGATRVLAAFSQVDEQGSAFGDALTGPELVLAGPPGGHDAYRAVLPAESGPDCGFAGCIPPRPLVDGRMIIEVRYKSPTTGDYGIFHEAEYESIAATVGRSALILTPGQQLVGQLSFEARREVRATVTLTLSGKRTGSGKGWRQFASESADVIVGTGDHQTQTPSLKTKCPRRYDKCKANVKGGIFTQAAGRWWPSGDAAAKLKYD